MGVGAQLNITEVRQATRYPVNYQAAGEHGSLGTLQLHIVNVSRQGFLLWEKSGAERGDRLLMALPVVGRIEAICLWTRHQQAGFQFERPLRLDEFDRLLQHMNFRKARLRA